MATTTGRPPLWRDVRVLAWAVQLLAVALVVAVVWWLMRNYRANSARQGLATDWRFLEQPAQFPIANSTFRQTQSVQDALVIGLKNTLRLSLTAIALATVLGIALGVARLSHNVLVRSAARVYVEFVRNVPLLVLLLLAFVGVVQNAFPRPNQSWVLGPIAVVNVRGANAIWYEGANWRALVAVVLGLLAGIGVASWRRRVAERTGRPGRGGLFGLLVGAVVLVVAWLVLGLGVTTPELEGSRVTGGINMTASYFAALFALVVYTSSHIAEIVRGSIQAVPRGQGEAADALALSGFQRLWFVVLPQALRIGVPAIGNQYLNLAKNSSLAAVVAFPELTKVTQLTVAAGSPAVPAFTLLLAIYLVISLLLSLVVNIANRRLAVVER
jgi:general L-amino acid transport system permease protein